LERRRASDEEGFTLVELVVSLMLITLVLSSFLMVTLQAVAGGRIADGRTKANQILTERLELLQATKWSLTGLFAGDCGYWGATDGGEPTVTLTGSRAGSEPYPLLGGSCAATTGQAGISRGGNTYTVQQHITWRDDPADGTGGSDTDYDGTHDQKHFTVTVSWTQAGKLRSVSADAYRSPTTSEVTPKAPKAVGFVLDASATGDQILDSTNALSTAITLTVVTSQAASSVTTTYQTRTGTTVPQALTPDASYTTWTKTLPVGACCFNAGAEIFNFSGTAGSAVANATAQVSLRSSTAGFTVTGSAQPSSIPLTQTNQLSTAINLSATTSTAVATVYVTYIQNGAAVDLNLSPNSSRTTWTGSIPANSATFVDGPLSVTFTASTSTGDATYGRSVTLTPYVAPVTINSIALLKADNSDASSVGICIADNGNSGHFSQYTTRKLVATFQNLITTGASKDTVALTWTNLHSGGSVVPATPVVSGPDSSGVTTITWTYTVNNDYGFGPSNKNAASPATTPTVTVTRTDGSSATYSNPSAYPVPNVTSGNSAC
jgi:hypothetical protein